MKLVKEIDLIQIKKDNFDDVVKFIRKHHSEKECKIELLHPDSEKLFSVKVTFYRDYTSTFVDIEYYFLKGSYIASDISCSRGTTKIYKITKEEMLDKLEYDGYVSIE